MSLMPERVSALRDAGLFIVRVATPSASLRRMNGAADAIQAARRSESADDFAREVAAALRSAGLAIVLDLANEKINAKVRKHSLQHVPVIAVLGRKEAAERTVTLRRLGTEAQQKLPLAEAVARLAAEAMAPDMARARAGSADGA